MKSALQIISIVVILSLLLKAVSACQQHARVQQAFIFVDDLADYANVHGALPPSVDVFASWAAAHHGRDWNAKDTSGILRFVWLAPTHPDSPSDLRLLEMLDKRLKPYEQALNQRLRGHVDPKVFSAECESSCPTQ